MGYVKAVQGLGFRVSGLGCSAYYGGYVGTEKTNVGDI